MPAGVADRSLMDRALEVLRRAGNPFRNYFARNPDDDVCARYHVPELFAPQREQLLGVVDLYRYDPTTHSEMVPVLGNKGAGKTHLLHSIKHGREEAWQLLVTPGTFQKNTNFLEYLLFQVIDTLLGGGIQKGARPLEFVGEEQTRRLMHRALSSLDTNQQLDLFPAVGLGKWGRKLGLGTSAAQEKTQWLIDNLAMPLTARNAHSKSSMNGVRGSLIRICQECNLSPEQACEVVCQYIEKTESHDTTGLMRRHIYQGMVRSALLGDESDLASFLTFGFAELNFNVQPNREDLVLILFKVLMNVFLELKIPVVVAFDQLEDLLLARRSDDGHRVAESFFAGIVQVMHQIEGICFLIFAERGLWNRFVPSLDGYIQDRLNNPVHVPGFGTIKALRLEAPPPELLRRVVEARMRHVLEELPDFGNVSSIFPFTDEQVIQIARTEPTLRDMLQQFRHLFDHLIYGDETNGVPVPPANHANRIPAQSSSANVKSTVVVETPANEQRSQPPAVPDYAPEPPPALMPASEGQPQAPAVPAAKPSQPVQATGYTTNELTESESAAMPIACGAMDEEQRSQFIELWEQELRSARRKLEPDGSLTGATRELQGGLGLFLQTCHEHGVKVGPWRLQHVVGELTFGDHPTYGACTVAHWVCKDGEPWKVGIGLFLARGSGKPRDLEIKISALNMQPPVIDHLILLRPEDDLSLTGKSKTLWQQAESEGRSARIEPVTLDAFAALVAFPRFLSGISEALPEGQPMPNLADLIQEQCEKLLEQVCMPCP